MCDTEVNSILFNKDMDMLTDLFLSILLKGLCYITTQNFMRMPEDVII
jgi:hypothetical protein